MVEGSATTAGLEVLTIVTTETAAENACELVETGSDGIFELVVTGAFVDFGDDGNDVFVPYARSFGKTNFGGLGLLFTVKFSTATPGFEGELTGIEAVSNGVKALVTEAALGTVTVTESDSGLAGVGV